MRVLVTGASGFIGSAVVRELVLRGHAVRALVRAQSRTENLESLDVERALGDVLDRASVVRALSGCDAVVHTAGVVHFRPDDQERLFAVNARSVEIVLGAALEARVERAVLTSSTAVLGGTARPQVMNEASPSNAEALGIAYFVAKARGERAALDAFRRGLPVVVVRPSFVLGPGDVYRSSAGIVLAIARGQYPVYVSGGVSFCDVRDVAHGHVEALLRGRAGEAYILGGHNMELDELMQMVARLGGLRAPRRIPYALGWVLAAASEALDAARGKVPHLTRQLLASSHLYTYVSSAKAMGELGYTMRPFETSIRDTLRYFLQQGKLAARTEELRAIAAAPP
jgi:dihydroflavonol-4-reductase